MTEIAFFAGAEVVWQIGGRGRVEETQWSADDSSVKYALFLLTGQWSGRTKTIRRKLEDAGIRCSQTCPAHLSSRETLFEVLVFTDSARTAELYSRRGAVCVGCSDADAYFSGAGLVTGEPDALELHTLEAYVKHSRGLPVTIARTERLIIREMSEEDSARLCEIRNQWESTDVTVFAKTGGTDVDEYFEPQWLGAYIRNVYPFYGYGLWSVLRRDGTLIGCCGLTDWEGMEPAPFDASRQSGLSLELHYMVDKRERRRGYAKEMCRAAIHYAFEVIGAEAVYVRVHESNAASLGLAQKLGFKTVLRTVNEILLKYAVN